MIPNKVLIKNLECCKYESCKECPRYDPHTLTCNKYDLFTDIIDAFNRLKQRNNKYHNKIQAQKGELTRLYKQISELKAEIERLKSCNNVCVEAMGEQEIELTRLYKQVAEQKAKLKKLNERVLRTESLLDGARYEYNCLIASVSNKEKDQAWINGYYLGWNQAITRFAKELKEKLIWQFSTASYKKLCKYINVIGNELIKTKERIKAYEKDTTR